MSSSFDLAIGGRLKLKGDDDERKKKKKKKRKHQSDADDQPIDAPIPAPSEGPEASALTPVPGTGTVQTSGTIVMGADTRFSRELTVGDSLCVTIIDRFRNTTADEAREVTMVIGDSSANLAAPFSCDVTSPSAFAVAKAVPDAAAAAAAAAAERKRRRAEERAAAEGTVEYEVVKEANLPWKTTVKVTERLGAGRTREDVLDYRCTKKSDKFCK